MMNDADILARTIWGEMRSEGDIGMRAVACIVMNRVAKQSWYGYTISDVCLKHCSNVYQFDACNPDDPNFDKCTDVTLDDPQFVIAMSIASEAVAGNLLDITRGSLNYYSETIPLPPWAIGKIPTMKIGNTLFFNNID